MTFEFTIEVRPEFDLPAVEGPEAQAAGPRVHRRRRRRAARADAGPLRPAGAASTARPPRATTSSVNITSTADGKQVAHEHEDGRPHSPDAELPRRPARRLRQADEGRQGRRHPHGRGRRSRRTRRTPSCAARRSTLEFEVLDVKKLKLPELTRRVPAGNRRLRHRRRAARRDSQESRAAAGISAAARRPRARSPPLLTKSADWELPPGLLERQSARELERAVMELRRSGFSEAEIRARENELRQNSTASHRHGAEGALHPRADRRGGEDRRRRGRLREGNLPDRRAKRRIAPARAGPARKTRPDGRAAEPDHRAQGARSGAVGSQVQGRAVRAGKERHGSDLDGGRRRQRLGHPRSHGRKDRREVRTRRPARQVDKECPVAYSRLRCLPLSLSPCLERPVGNNCHVSRPRATAGALERNPYE